MPLGCIPHCTSQPPALYMIYLDANATSPIAPEVLEAMLPYLKEHYANPSAGYRSARLVQRAVETAREQVAALIGASADEIIFTSGGTEADNAAIACASLGLPQRRHLIIGATEHSAVIEPARRWSKEGGDLTLARVHPDGVIDMERLQKALRLHPTALVSIMWVNNETGVIAPVHEIAQVAHETGALFHSDAVQAAGRLPIQVGKLPVDYLSLSGHKMHGPKGVGALFISRRVRFRPGILGGSQESDRRGGTENVSSIVGFGKAAELAAASLDQQTAVAALRDTFEATVRATLPNVTVNGHLTQRLAGTSSLCFPGLAAAEMLILLDSRGVCCSAGSACHAGEVHPSHVLEAMGMDAARAASTLRFSFSRLNTAAEAEEAATHVIAVAGKLQSLAAISEGPVVLS